MQVNNLYLRNVKIGLPELPAQPVEAVRATRTGNASLPESSDCVLSDELRHLVSLARQEPELRRDRLEEVAQLLATGELQSSRATVDTAEAVLNSDD